MSEVVARGREERADEATTKRMKRRTCERGGPPKRDVGAAEQHECSQLHDFTNVKLR